MEAYRKGVFLMYIVYVLNVDGKPLMPTQRFGHVRRLLKAGQAKAVSTKPFVVQLQYESEGITQPLYGGTDPGRTNIGEAVINGKGEIVYAAHVTSRNKEIPKLMAKRAAHRRASRHGERLRRKRRAKRNGTTTEFPGGRRLPGYEDGVMALKDIINTESRFNNRKRPAGWITPTARQCVQTHINIVRHICKILPVTSWTLEYNCFAFMQLEDGSIRGLDFQNGRLKGYACKEDYVSALQNGRCILCGNPIEHYHHILPKYKGGSDTPENLIGLCNACHADVHKHKQKLNRIGLRKRYAGTSIVNIAMPFIWNELVRMFGDSNVHVCEGADTARIRELNDIPKEHFADAACIASAGFSVGLQYDEAFEIWQFRNHDRSLVKAQIERVYKLDGKIVAKNRNPRFEQNGKALSDWQSENAKEFNGNCVRRMISRLSVKPSSRRYNDVGRIFPGAVFMHSGKTYLLRGQLTNGSYYRAFGESDKNFPSKHCKIVSSGYSLTYV